MNFAKIVNICNNKVGDSMIYLDYSATTPVNEEVLESFNKTSLNYIGNANSLHKLGVESKKLMEAAVKQVSDILNVNSNEIIFTSGASESNNLAIFGVINKYKNRGKHIITTKLEHSSILSCVNYLKQNGYIIDYVKIDDNGLVDLNDLKKLVTNDTVLVSICEVNSEIGLIQNVNEIGEFLKDFPRCIFHVDGTQAIGKKQVNLENIDLYSFSAHKIYGLKGIGCLVKKENIQLEPIIHGGKSQTIYRSGTPALPLMVSFAKALKLVNQNFKEKYDHVLSLKSKLIESLKNIPNVYINSNDLCVPHIINISILNIKPETMLHALEQKEIYISTKTACSSDEGVSLSVYTLTNDLEKAKSSIRISLSYLTTIEEIDIFIKEFIECVKTLSSIRG